MDDPLVRVEVAAGISTITLDSPNNRNALSRRLLAELGEALAAARDDTAVRGVVLTATGNTFCAGADLKDPPGRWDESSPSIPGVISALWTFPKTIVLKLNGHVRAGGLGLVAASDIVVAPASATFAFTEVRIGVAPGIIAVVCSRRMTPRALSRYTLTGEVFSAADAESAGLVTLAVADDDVERATAELLDGIRLTEPKAVRTTKELLLDLPALSLEDGLRHAEGISLELFRSPEAAEGIAAFREKRRPSWAPSTE